MPILPDFPRFVPSEDGWRHRPAEYVCDPRVGPRGWYQDGRKLRHVKASKAFIWPKDGKNGSTWGRIKDIFQNTGPDIYVAFGANKADCVLNRPPRAQWSRHTNLDDRNLRFEFDPRKFSPWTRNSALGGRMPGLSYDFRTRKYRTPNSRMWTDAIWQQEPYRNRKWNSYPEALRTHDGTWWQDMQYLPQHQGGPVHNEFGHGIGGFQLPLWPLL
ncbi:Nn.00g086750.m01.CDS01 [Neocucurbitaria sp. VM-36]